MINHATKRIRSTASSRRTNYLIFHIPARDCENSRNPESAQRRKSRCQEKIPVGFLVRWVPSFPGSLSGGVVPMRESGKWTGHLKSGSGNRALKNSKASVAEV